MSTSTDFIRLLQERRQLHQCSDEAGLNARFAEGIVTGYIGYDCTAPSLHVGHLANMMMLRRLQQVGGRPLVIMGGGTTKIGDPSFRDDQRKMTDAATINANMASIKTAFDKVMRFGDGPTDAVMIDNAAWLDRLEYIPFLRDVGRHFSVNRMLSFESVKTRMEREQSLSFLEFNYMILQAYDFVELNRRYGCILQMGGSDQWGNIVNGIELGHKMLGVQLYAATCPLLTTSSGAKMGKTASGAVWLNAEQLPDFDFWQYWRNTEDGDVGRFLRIFTDMAEDEIVRLEALQGSQINEAKKLLATEITALVRGRDAAERAAAAAKGQFEGGAAGDLPSVEYMAESIKEGVLVANLMTHAGLAKSTSEARRLIKSAGVSVNDVVWTDERGAVSLIHVIDGRVKLSLGKKRHVLVKPV
ncbi:MAG: tyrosine--tRNA ligase [Alphaproteobacteria bacterium]|nr:tyrosine--tRNA ligase [Alphaproteobacteria bacterium]